MSDGFAAVGSPEYMVENFTDRHPSTLHLLRFFAWSHLPEKLGGISSVCAVAAMALVGSLPDGPELTAGLRKLLEAKDCFVRAAIPTDETRRD